MGSWLSWMAFDIDLDLGDSEPGTALPVSRSSSVKQGYPNGVSAPTVIQSSSGSSAIQGPVLPKSLFEVSTPPLQSAGQSSHSIATLDCMFLSLPYRSSPKPKRPRYHHLPPELILQILEHNYYTHSNEPTPDRHILLQLSLVSRAWSKLAQHLLFRRVTLTEEHLPGFLNAVESTSERAKYLGGSVRTLELTLGSTKECQVELARTLVACPLVYELDLRFQQGASRLEDEAISILRASPPSITTFSLFNQRDSAVLWQLLQLFRPTLQFLFVDIALGPLEASWRPHKTTCLPKLTEYAWCDYSSYGFTKEILQASVGSLEVLSVYGLLPDDVFEHLLETHGPYLRALRLQACRRTLSHIIARNCTKLEEFGSYKMPSAEVLAALPDSIEHVGFYQTSPVTQSVLNFLEKKPKLRVLTYVWGSSDPRIDEIEAICARRGIEVRHELRKEDRIKSPRFPRDVSTENFRYMPYVNAKRSPISSRPECWPTADEEWSPDRVNY